MNPAIGKTVRSERASIFDTSRVIVSLSNDGAFLFCGTAEILTFKAYPK